MLGGVFAAPESVIPHHRHSEPLFIAAGHRSQEMGSIGSCPRSMGARSEPIGSGVAGGFSCPRSSEVRAGVGGRRSSGSSSLRIRVDAPWIAGSDSERVFLL